MFDELTWANWLVVLMSIKETGELASGTESNDTTELAEVSKPAEMMDSKAERCLKKVNWWIR